MRLMVLEYNNLFKYLFDKYRGTGGASIGKRKGSLGVLSMSANNGLAKAETEQVITLIEVVRCLREHGHDTEKMLTVKELGGLMKAVNSALMSKHGTDATEFSGFV